MGAQNMHPNGYCNEPELQHFYIAVVAGSAAITSYDGGPGVTVTRTAAGQWTVQLPDSLYTSLRYINGSAPDLSFEVENNNVASDGSIDIIWTDLDGTPTDVDPADTTLCFIHVVVDPKQ